MAVRREQAAPTFFGSLVVALLATLFSFLIVDGIFLGAVHDVLSTLNVQSAPHFSLPSRNWVFVVICFFVGLTAICWKSWAFPLIAGLLGYAMIIPEYTTEGPITASAAFMALINLHIDLLGVALVLNVVFAAIWIRESKRNPTGASHTRPISTPTQT